jgi:DivIVA domain-containing protein
LLAVEAIVHVVSAPDPASELRALRSSLLFDEVLRGSVQLRSAASSGGQPAGEALVVALDTAGAGSALSSALSGWLPQRDPAVRLRVAIDIGRGTASPGAARELGALLTDPVLPQAQPAGAVPGGAVPGGAVPGGDRQRLIERIENSVFSRAPLGRRGYDETKVDQFLDAIIASLRHGPLMEAREVEQVMFPKPRFGARGYDEDDVDDLLEEVQKELPRLGR